MAGSYIASWPLFQQLTQMRPRESDQARRAPCRFVGGSSTLAAPLSVSIRPR